MTNFLERRRDWQIDMVIADRDKGRISDGKAQEDIVLIQENYEKANKWMAGNA